MVGIDRVAERVGGRPLVQNHVAVRVLAEIEFIVAVRVFVAVQVDVDGVAGDCDDRHVGRGSDVRL